MTARPPTRRPKFLAAVAVFTALSTLACSGLEEAAQPEPVPADKIDYVGSWTGDKVELTITAEGNCEYTKEANDSAKTSINAPIQSFHPTGFDVGIGPFVTTFVVTKPPHEDGGVWTMTVDDVELTRN